MRVRCADAAWSNLPGASTSRTRPSPSVGTATEPSARALASAAIPPAPAFGVARQGLIRSCGSVPDVEAKLSCSVARAANRGRAAIGTRVRQRRQSLGLSQRDLSEPGISYAYISRIEVGARTPSVKALRKLAPKLGVSVEWLETGAQSPAEHLARLVLDHDGRPPAAAARGLARRVLDQRTGATRVAP
jgi:transcriptional regulator with XRE-family HTH domain